MFSRFLYNRILDKGLVDVSAILSTPSTGLKTLYYNIPEGKH